MTDVAKDLEDWIYTHMPPVAKALAESDLFVRVLQTLRDAPTNHAYNAACRALHWRTAQLRANGIEPTYIAVNAPHYPPPGFQFTQPTALSLRLRTMQGDCCKSLCTGGEHDPMCRTLAEAVEVIDTENNQK